MSNFKKQFDPQNIEVVVFGPGYGECALFHYGDNNWIIIDSCINPQTHLPAALSYFERFGIDPAHSVNMIVATHWHDDHIRGLSTILERCPKAKFVFASALNKREFVEIISINNETRFPVNGIREFNQILNILYSRKQEIVLAIENRRILNHASSIGDCEVFSLSPSDASVLSALQNIGSLLPEQKDRNKDIVALEPNYLAIALWIKINETKFLFGSDLQDLDSSIGWQRIVESRERPTGFADIFKIPHHGSSNASNHDVWNKMLIENVYAVVTPFNRGPRKLPSQIDIDRINEYTDNGYITAKAKGKKPKHNKHVDKLLEGAVKNIKFIDHDFGGVRFIKEEGKNWSVECNGSASLLNLIKVT